MAESWRFISAGMRMVGSRTGRVFGRCAAVALLSGLLFTMFAAAQTASSFDTGTITGTVTDSSGAVIPSATVEIIDTGIAQHISARTDGDGIFVVPGLPFGTYTVAATARAFAKTITKPFELNVGATVRVDLKLAVAAATENVTVTGTSVTIDTNSATAGTTLNQDQIRNLPTNGRDVMDFLEIAPGSINSTGYFQGSVNGQENFLTGLNVTLDGQNSSRPDVNGFDETEGNEANRITRASIDSIQEIDFANSGYSAEVGDSLGPQMRTLSRKVARTPSMASCSISSGTTLWTRTITLPTR